MLPHSAVATAHTCSLCALCKVKADSRYRVPILQISKPCITFTLLPSKFMHDMKRAGFDSDLTHPLSCQQTENQSPADGSGARKVLLLTTVTDRWIMTRNETCATSDRNCGTMGCQAGVWVQHAVSILKAVK